METTSARQRLVLLVSYDTECTSIGAYNEHVVQIGATHAVWNPSERTLTQTRAPGGDFCEYVLTDRAMNPRAEEITGISNKTLKGARRFRDVCVSFMRWIADVSRGHDGGVVLVGFNSDVFDFRIMTQEMERHSIAPCMWKSCGVTTLFDLLVWMRRRRLEHAPGTRVAFPKTKTGRTS